MERALRAIAHPRRLSILRAVSRREHSVGELARALGMRQPAASQHLLVLKQAKLVVVRPEANQRYYRANATELAKLRGLLSGFWRESLHALKTAAEVRVRKGTTRP